MRPLEGSKVFHSKPEVERKLDYRNFLKIEERGKKWPRRACKVSAKSYSRKILTPVAESFSAISRPCRNARSDGGGYYTYLSFN